MYLVTGYGSIGSLVVKRILQKYPDALVTIIDKNEEAIHRARIEMSSLMKYPGQIQATVADVANRWDLEKIFHNFIKIVVHTAAMKHVTFCEDNPHLASINNIVGINNLLELSKLNQVDRFVNVSTDKCAYPANVMGATKFIAERSVISYDNLDGPGSYLNTRLGNVLCSTGSLIPTIRRIMKNKAKLQITDLAATRFFITKEEVADFIVEIATDQTYDGQVLIKKLRSATLETMINAVFRIVGDYSYNVVGLRQGEKLHEHLFTETENTHMVDHGDHWSIDFNRPKQAPIKVIDSSDPGCLITEDELTEILKKAME